MATAIGSLRPSRSVRPVVAVGRSVAGVARSIAGVARSVLGVGRPVAGVGRPVVVVMGVVTAGTLALGGCSSGVEVTAPSLAGDSSCVAASTHWPPDVSKLRPVATSPESPAVRAWGDPAVIARCGVATPGPSTDGCLSVNGVDWLAIPLSDGTKFVTYGRAPALEVLVPKAYAPEGSLLPAFTDAATRLPTTGGHCS